MQQLHFSLRGEDFEAHLFDLLRSGEYLSFMQHMEHTSIPFEYQKMFAHSLMGMTGKDSDMSLYTRDTPAISEEDYFYGLMTCLRTHDIRLCEFMTNEHEQLKAFDKYFSRQKWSRVHQERITERVHRILTQAGLDDHIMLPTDDRFKKGWSPYGIILFDGTFYQVGDRDHIYEYPRLFELGLVTEDDWLDEHTSIPVSYGVIKGRLSFRITWLALGSRESEVEKLDNVSYGLYETCVKLAPYISFDRTMNMGTAVLAWTESRVDKGGKYNGLAFMETFGLNTPQRSLTAPTEVEGWCIRTSPTHSIGGVLDSVFDITETSVEEIQSTFEEKNPVEGNELHLFYQKYVDGSNGVCHYDHNGFRYSCSSNRGDIVDGKGGNVVLGKSVGQELENAAKLLYKMFGEGYMVQLEFCVDNGGELYFLQFRKFYTPRKIADDPQEYLHRGISFTAGEVEVSVGECLICDSDVESVELVGKKALICVNVEEYAHILALSQSLQIPSIIIEADNFEEFKSSLPETFVIDSRRTNGFILQTK